MAESGSPWQTHRTFLKYRAKQKRTALIRHCRWHKIPQTDNWVFPKCPRQLRSRAPGEPPKRGVIDTFPSSQWPAFAAPTTAKRCFGSKPANSIRSRVPEIP